MSRGIFGLNESYNEQISGDWSTASDVWLLASPVIVRESPFGYFGGGHDSPSYSSSILRIDYSNDSANATSRGTLTTATRFVSATGNISYGYFDGGGDPAPGKTIIDRLDYSNDTATATPKGPLASATYKASATGNADYGYWGGGKPSPSSGRTLVERLDFANDTATAVAKGSLSAARYFLTATGNLNHGYFGGGASYPAPADVTTVDRLDYSSDTTACVAKGPLSGSGSEAPAASSNANFGYYGGGASAPGPKSSKVERLDYSSDTTAAVAKGPLTDVKKLLASTGNSSHGYFAGGNVGPDTSDIDRVDYSNDTATAITKAMLPAANKSMGGVSAAANALASNFIGTTSNIGFNRVPIGTDYGYFTGGDPAPAGGTRVYRLDYTTDTTVAVEKGNKTVASRDAQNGASNINYGYIGGGYSPASDRVSTVDRIDYSNDTATAVAKGPLDTSSNGVSAAGNKDFGYWVMGRGPGPDGNPYYTNLCRVDYSNDTATATPKGYLSATIYGAAATGNMNAAYFAGGASDISTIQRIVYSNDTTTQVRGPLSFGRIGAMGAGYASYGYFAAGSSPAKSTVDRVDYSSDTATALVRGNLDAGMYRDGSTGNAYFGYFAPGPAGQPNKRALARIDYSNDTATAVTRGNVINDADYRTATSPRENALPTQNIYSTTASSSEETLETFSSGPAYGYVAGASGSSDSRVDRIDFSNDTVVAPSQGTLTTARNKMAAVGNTSYGYFAGGDPHGSRVERLDYGNDTAVAPTKGPLSAARQYLGAAGNTDYGWLGGGTPSGSSTVDRIDYGNDTATAATKGFLSATNHALAGTGNNNYGWFGGGMVPAGNAGVTTVDRLDYANDTSNLVTKGPLSAARGYISAAGNSDYGWFAGGGYPSKTSIVDRVDYSNDTATAVAKGSLPSTQTGQGGTGNTSYGWFAGYYPSSYGSRVYRIDYSSDLSTPTERGPLSVARQYACATSAQENGLLQRKLTISTPFAFGEYTSPNPYGYYGNGNNYATLVDRIDYSNDTSSPTRRGYLVAGNCKYGGGVASLNHGYFTGGETPSASVSRVERIDFSNDMVHSSIRGPLTAIRVNVTATGTKDYGYVGGGYGPPHVTNVDRINYANDTTTASPRGPLSAATYTAGATGNPSYGYWGGGNTLSTISRLDYSNDTATATAKGPLSVAARFQMATGNKDYGWWGGGSPSPGKSTVDRLDYANDTATASTRGPLNTGRYRHGATGNTTQGYFIAGQPGTITTIERVDYSNDTVTPTFVAPIITNVGNSMTGAFSSQANGLPQGQPQGTVGSYGAGYICGGNPTSPGYNGRTLVQRIDYANDTTTLSVRGPLSTNNRNMGAASGTSHGYFGGGGYSGGSPGLPIHSIVQRIDYSNDTATGSTLGNLTSAEADVSGTSNINFGYFGGGRLPNACSTVHRIDYGSDTTDAVAKGPLSVARGWSATVCNENYGYWAAGKSPSPSPLSTVDRIDYNNDTATASPKGPLTAIVYAAAGASSPAYGYIAGGRSPSPGYSRGSVIDRINFSNDTPTALEKSHLVDKKNRTRYMTATGNENYGYFCGGAYGSSSPSPVSRVDRLDYSNDTLLTSIRGPLVEDWSSAGGVSARSNSLSIIGSTIAEFTNIVTQQHYPSSQRGYWAGGDVSPSYGGYPYLITVQRIDFANDTAGVSQRAELSEDKNGPVATGNEDFGYIAGGYGSDELSTVERLDYANDTTSPVTKGPLSAKKRYLAAAGNSDFGYFGGGLDGPSSGLVSTVERIDYSNDTPTATVKGPLSLARYWFGAAGNMDFGYFGGGVIPSPAVVSTVDRVDYSNDSATAVAKGSLSLARQKVVATGNKDYGWFGGGSTVPSPSPQRSTVDRVDYSNDTATAAVKGPLSVARFGVGATGNINYGYWGGGGTPSDTSVVDRIDYSNDTVTALERTTLFFPQEYSSTVSGGANALPQFGG